MTAALKKCFIIFAVIWLLPETLLGQNSLVELERAWQEDRFEDIQTLLPAAERDYPQNPTVAFFRALMLDDAENAFASYKKVFDSLAESRYADTALFKMAQYQYARERFASARKYFHLLQKRFPQTKWLDDSAYLVGQCYSAEGKADSARLVLAAFIHDYPRSPYCDLAIADLESSTGSENAARLAANSAKPAQDAGPYYAVQVGAFSNPQNARTILAGLEKVGYEGQIVQKQVGSRSFQCVWIGRFADRAAAEDYASRFIVKVTREYSIVKSE
jgi:hypothetical protein